MTAEAKRRAKGNVAYIPPQEVFAMVDEYYGITATEEPVKKMNVMDFL